MAVAPPLMISCILILLFAWNAPSPTDKTLSKIRMSGLPKETMENDSHRVEVKRVLNRRTIAVYRVENGRHMPSGLRRGPVLAPPSTSAKSTQPGRRGTSQPGSRWTPTPMSPLRHRSRRRIRWRVSSSAVFDRFRTFPRMGRRLGQIARQKSTAAKRSETQKIFPEPNGSGKILVGVTGFEPAASCSQTF